MKKLQMVAVLIAGLFTATFAMAEGDNPAIYAKGGVAIKGYDTVSYWTKGEPEEGSEEFTTEWHGATWQFASEENLNLFKENPEKYAPQYGGWCAWAMSDITKIRKGKVVRSSPKAWTIYNDKLYLNFNQNVLKEWLTTKDQDIKNADEYYPTVTDVADYN